jgi:hypothetical protein
VAQATDEGEALKGALLKAIQLPLIAEMARKVGINPGDLKEVLLTARDEKIPAGEMIEVLDASVRASDEHGPINNFGAFVQSKLKEGLRGRDLAKAIRQEHVARGKGKSDSGKGKPHKEKDKDKDNDRDDDK